MVGLQEGEEREAGRLLPATGDSSCKPCKVKQQHNTFVLAHLLKSYAALHDLRKGNAQASENLALVQGTSNLVLDLIKSGDSIKTNTILDIISLRQTRARALLDGFKSLHTLAYPLTMPSLKVSLLAVFGEAIRSYQEEAFDDDPTKKKKQSPPHYLQPIQVSLFFLCPSLFVFVLFCCKVSKIFCSLSIIFLQGSGKVLHDQVAENFVSLASYLVSLLKEEDLNSQLLMTVFNSFVLNFNRPSDAALLWQSGIFQVLAKLISDMRPLVAAAPHDKEGKKKLHASWALFLLLCSQCQRIDAALEGEKDSEGKAAVASSDEGKKELQAINSFVVNLAVTYLEKELVYLSGDWVPPPIPEKQQKGGKKRKTETTPTKGRTRKGKGKEKEAEEEDAEIAAAIAASNESASSSSSASAPPKPAWQSVSEGYTRHQRRDQFVLDLISLLEGEFQSKPEDKPWFSTVSRKLIHLIARVIRLGTPRFVSLPPFNEKTCLPN